MELKKGDFAAVGIVSEGTFGGAERDFKIGVVHDVSEDAEGIEIMFLPWGKECDGYRREIQLYPKDRILPAENVWPCMKGINVVFHN